MKLECGCTQEDDCPDAAQIRAFSDRIRDEENLMQSATAWPGRRRYAAARREYYLHRGPLTPVYVWEAWYRLARSGAGTIFSDRDAQVGSYSEEAKAAMMCRVIDAILNHGMTLYGAAGTVPADRRTVYTWSHEEPFRSAIREAERCAAAGIRL